MAYVKLVKAYNKTAPPSDKDSQKEYLDAELQGIQVAIKTLADAVAEIKQKLAAASVLPIT